MEKIYLYGALAGRSQVKPGEVKIGDRTVKLASETYDGISIVFGIVPQDFLSVYSRREILDWIAVHQQVINYLYDRARVIPFKAGTMLDSAVKLTGLVRDNKGLFSDIFGRLAARDEWDIVISIEDMQLVLQMIGEGPAVKALKEQIREKDTASREDLQELQSLHLILEDQRLILILPDADPQTVAQGHSLRPRYLTNIHSDFQDVASVLRKIMGASPSSKPPDILINQG